MKTLIAVFLFCMPGLALAGTTDITFLLHGKPLKTLSLDEMKKLVPPVEMAVWEPHESKDVTYTGFPANKLLDKVYGPEWKKVEEVLFTCADGYQPSLSVGRFLKYDGMFAVARVGGKFSLINTLQANEKVALGPLYLVWNNVKAPELKKLKGEGWPYQVVKVDLVDAADRFPHMAPPKNASAAVKRGFQDFRAHCFACHSVNGDGGNKAIDLNRPTNVTEYRKESWLERWIMNPSSIRPGTTMPSLPVEGKAGEKIADDIIAYLKAMAKKKD